MKSINYKLISENIRSVLEYNPSNDEWNYFFNKETVLILNMI